MAEAKGADIQSVYVEKRVFDPTKEFVEKARLKNMDEYKKMWERSIEDPEGFRGERWGKASSASLETPPRLRTRMWQENSWPEGNRPAPGADAMDRPISRTSTTGILAFILLDSAP
jgi:hypothetical protein